MSSVNADFTPPSISADFRAVHVSVIARVYIDVPGCYPYTHSLTASPDTLDNNLA